MRIAVGIYGPYDQPGRPQMTGLLTVREEPDGGFCYLSYLPDPKLPTPWGVIER